MSRRRGLFKSKSCTRNAPSISKPNISLAISVCNAVIDGLSLQADLRLATRKRYASKTKLRSKL
jgi:hypothetical protein